MSSIYPRKVAGSTTRASSSGHPCRNASTTPACSRSKCLPRTVRNGAKSGSLRRTSPVFSNKYSRTRFGKQRLNTSTSSICSAFVSSELGRDSLCSPVSTMAWTCLRTITSFRRLKLGGAISPERSFNGSLKYGRSCECARA